MNVYLFLLSAVFISIKFCQSARIPNAFLPSDRQTSSDPGLYGPEDKVIALTAETLRANIYEQFHGTEVEFYNSFCGFCKRFAPIYKEYAASLVGWRDIVKIAAVDCAADDNSDICRTFEIMAYPTIRYYPPFYKNGEKRIGINVDHVPMKVGHPALITLLMNEERPPKNWPKLKPIDVVNKTSIFNDEHNQVQYMFLVHDFRVANHTTVAQDVALDYHKVKTISIRQVASAESAAKIGVSTNEGLYVIARNTNEIQSIPTEALNRTIIFAAVKSYIETNQISSIDLSVLDENVGVSTSTVQIDNSNVVEEIQKLQDLAIIEEVKSKRQVVFQADLEAAIKYSIYHELTQHNEFNDEQFIAMQRFIQVLRKYSPLGSHGRGFLIDLNTFITSKGGITGKILGDKIEELDVKWAPIFSSKRWVGCQGSAPSLRGFTCGLWILFHYLTVQASHASDVNDPLEVLRAVHGFVKNFFGCSECSQHFQTMAIKNNIWGVPTKDQAVLWLWTAHNEVNKRLAGDTTEDPVFPKVQFPTEATCPECYSINSDNGWNQTEVLNFLNRIHRLSNIDRLGVDDESLLPEYLETTRNKRDTIGFSEFSDFDVRMGLLLYACCIAIIVVAVKLFLKRGYRKKLYIHDLLGKV